MGEENLTKFEHMYKLDEETEADKIMELYDDWANTYTEMYNTGIYNASRLLAAEVARHVPANLREDMLVLDVAAGTGCVGLELKKLGFRNVDALEPSQGMLDILTSTGIYNRKYKEIIGTGQTTLSSDMYDLVVSAGGIGWHHIPVVGINELIRVAKPGALVTISCRANNPGKNKDITREIEVYMDILEQNGRWNKITKTVMPNYILDEDGTVFTYCVK